ncbi:MAG: NUDIX domain-containing protein [Balneolales bacterium]|nr:NUDIX domain-containing protein [Balneolales bacterium]
MKAKPLIAAGGIVFKINEAHLTPDVLLIFRNGTWDLPKGKLEKGESIPMCAAREVAEETGSLLPILVSDLGTTYHEYVEKENLFGKTTYWWAMVFPKKVELTPQKEEGILEISWKPIDKAIEIVGFENLREVLKRCFRLF